MKAKLINAIRRYRMNRIYYHIRAARKLTGTMMGDIDFCDMDGSEACSVIEHLDDAKFDFNNAYGGDIYD